MRAKRAVASYLWLVAVLGGIIPTSVSSGLNVTFAVVNDGSSVQAAGSVTQTKLIPFKDGDVCSGNAPVFTDQSNGHVLHFSYGLATYRASGCLQTATFVWRLDSSVAVNGPHTIAMTCCGSWPVQGSGTAGQTRTLTEVYNQNLLVKMPAAPGLTTASYGANLLGTWQSSLANDSNNYKVTKWFDGDAGTAWKISTEMVIACTGTNSGTTVVTAVSCSGTSDTTPLTTGETITGTNVPASTTITVNSSSQITLSATPSGAVTSFTVQHGQMRFDHYVESLTDSSGSLGGFRWTGMARQPKYITNTPSRQWRAFAIPDCVTPANGPNWSVGGGSATPLTWKGGDGNCMVPQAFTVSGSGQLINTSAANNYYFGSYNDGNAIPAYLSGGSLPPSSVAIDTHTVYYIRSNQSTFRGINANPKLEINGHGAPQNPNAQGICSTNPPTCSFTGSGSGTVTPIPLLMPFTKVTFADQNARYNFFQGTGSLTTETTLRAQINQTYWQSTGLIPPYMLTISGAAFGGNVADTTFDEPTLAYNPWNIGTFNQTQQDVGEHGDIGPWPNDAATWFYNDSKKDDYVIRAEGLSAALTAYDFKDDSLDMPINIVDSSTSTYTGMPNSVATSIDLSFNTGYTPGPSGNGSSVYSNGIDNPSHKPNYTDAAWMMTGELQYLDLLIDQGAVGVAAVDTKNRNPTNPDAFNGIYLGFFGNGETRTRAWVGRDVQTAAARCPYDPTGTATVYTFGGTQLCKYLRTMAAQNTQFAVDVQKPANNMYGSSTGYITSRGIFLGAPNINPSNAYSAPYALFTAKIDNGSGSPGTTLTVSSTLAGTVGANPPISAITDAGATQNITTGTTIESGSGPYTVNYSQLVSSENMLMSAIQCCGGYESTYTVYGFNIAAKMLGDANAATWLNTYISSQNYTLTTYGGFNLYGIADLEAFETGGNYGWPVVADDNHWAMKSEEWQTTLSWVTTPSPSGSVRAFSLPVPTVGSYSPANCISGACDVFIFCGSAEGCTPPGGLTAYWTPYCVRDLSTSAGTAVFNVGVMSGSTCGSAVPITNSGSQQGPGWWHTSPGNAPADTISGAFPSNADAVTAGRRAAVSWAQAIVGGTTANGVLSDANARLAAEGYDFALAPGNGVRYSMQNHFGP